MRIKDARAFAGLTQQQFADMFDIPIDTVKAWDCGRRKPDKVKEKFILKELERAESMIDWKQDKIRKAAEEFSSWRGKAVIMVDTSDGSVWTDVFSSGENRNEYKSRTIFQLYGKDNLHGRNIKPDAVKALIKAGAYKYPGTDDMPPEISELFCRYGL